jgi:hypothetical protein
MTRFVALVLGAALLGGCRQHAGRAVEAILPVNRVQTESATQMGAAFKFSGFEYLKAGPREAEPLKIY